MSLRLMPRSVLTLQTLAPIWKPDAFINVACEYNPFYNGIFQSINQP